MQRRALFIVQMKLSDPPASLHAIARMLNLVFHSRSTLRAPARGAAVHAFVASAVAHHYAAAVRAWRRVGLIDERLPDAAVFAVAQTGYWSHHDRPRFRFCRQRFFRLDDSDFALGFFVQELRRH